MRRRHLAAVVRIEEATNGHPWSRDLFANELLQPTSRHYLVAMIGPQVVGFGGLMQVADEGHITTMAVDRPHQRRGIGAALLVELMELAIDAGVVDATLEVRVSNDAAQAMYRRFGFAPEGVRPRYYRSPTEDALILWARGIDRAAYRRRLESIRAKLPT
ncbi:MAG: ribosomal protein S18-alanine N-acetyltransferase [Microthrixaceae bacterium]|nr:ribosomal protein S18-alanine N-acetyltransferase [Microthrixaceae bacterium]